ncbi:Glyceraldehyde-3-phosphate dehydrogenase GAPCP1, chloroplastic, partial [Kappamyces sp. JEL0829]
MAYLLKYDSIHGRLPHSVTVVAQDKSLQVAGLSITTSHCKTPGEIDWSLSGAEYIIESSGKFLSLAQTTPHLASGAKKVVIAAPSPDAPLFVYGVNHEAIQSSMDVISNSSCNTNCLALLCKVLNEEFGIVEGLMTTVHAITGTQMTVDSPCTKDRRRGRMASQNISPTTTGAAKSVAKVIPSLAGKMTGIAFRVPTPNVCIVDLTVKLVTPTSYDQVMAALEKWSKSTLDGLLAVSHENLVSSDLIGDSRSCVVDAGAGMALNETFMKFVCWTDNEHAYSYRLVDM